MKISRQLSAIFLDASTERTGNQEIPNVLSRLKKIRLTSGALLHTINESFLDNSTALDGHSKSWLSGKEPEACLRILQQMVDLTRVDTPADNLEGGEHHGEQSRLPSEGRINDAIALLMKRWNHFHFLYAAAGIG